MTTVRRMMLGMCLAGIPLALAGCPAGDDTGGAPDAGTAPDSGGAPDGAVTPDGGGGPGLALSLSHAGKDIPSGATYNVPDNITNPAGAAVAIFSEQKDRMVVTNRSDAAVTLSGITLTGSNGVVDEEFRICSTASGVNQCLPLTLGTLAAGDTADFYIHFYPVQSDQRTATLDIDFSGSAGGQKLTATIVGHGRIGSDEYPAYFSSKTTLDRHKLWGGFNNNQDEAPGPMAADAAGNVYFAGTGTALVGTSTSDRNIFVVKVKADGALGWQKIYHSSNHDQISTTGDNGLLGAADSMVLDGAGNLYLVARASNGSNKYIALIMKINTDTGAAVWTRYWHGNSDRLQYTDAAYGFAVDVKGSMVFVTGQAKSDVSTQGIPVIALDTSGNHLWSKLIVPQGSTGSAHRGHSVRADDAGNLYVAGIDYSTGGGPFVAKLSNVDASGTGVALSWAKTITGESVGSNFNSMDVDAAGNVFLATDRRGATTYFSVTRISADGTSVTGQTMPGTSGDRNNIYVVRVAGDSVYAGGRIGLSGWDTGKGDGVIGKMATSDLSLDWGSVYYTGTGPNEVCHHSVHGLAVTGGNLYTVGQVYTGNLNWYRYWGYWYDYPGAAEAYAPSPANVLAGTTLTDMASAGLVDSSHANFSNDGVFENMDPARNVEFQDATDKNEDSNGAATDADVFTMRLSLQ